MTGKTFTASILVCALALLAALQYGHAASAPAASSPAVSSLKIGLVSIRGVLDGSKKCVQYQAQAAKRRSQVLTELQDLARKAEAANVELKTLKQGTADYIKQLQVVLEARAKLQNQQDVLEQQRLMDDRKVFEKLYQEVLKAVEVVAKEKELDLVLERTEPKFPMSSGEEVSATVGTHKVLYANGIVDLTSDVTARIDASPTLNP